MNGIACATAKAFGDTRSSLTPRNDRELICSIRIVAGRVWPVRSVRIKGL